MVQRRERLKKRILASQQEILDLETSLLLSEDTNTCETETGGREDTMADDEEVEVADIQQTIRQTRYVWRGRVPVGGLGRWVYTVTFN